MPTPAQTPAQKHAFAPAASGRLSLALRELKRRLETELPAQIAYTNTLLGLTGNAAYQAPKAVVIAPVPVDDRLICNLIIGHSARIVNTGTRNFRIEAEILFYIPDRRIEQENQVLDASDRGAILATVLYQYLTGCSDLNDVRVWDSLVFQEQTVLPDAWKEYSGICLNYSLVQNPPANLWNFK